MITLMDPENKTKEGQKCLDPQLWHACAGSMVQMPSVNSKVFYFPQGHAEHANGNVEFRNSPRIPPYIACRVTAIRFMADPETDEVFAKIKLVPVSGNVADFDDGGINAVDNQEKPNSFAKTLTQSDANNGGGFSVPRYCAETIFPRLDYSADPPVQTILAKDVHGETWKFRHIYRGTPRRHLLTTGWSTFVNQKKLVAGDSIVFLRAENGDLCVGIRRAKRVNGESEASLRWNPTGGAGIPYGGFSAFLREDQKEMLRKGHGSSSRSSTSGGVKPESVAEAAILAANGQPFEVVYYPRASTPEFCVKAGVVNAALQIRWSSGMRFKMAFETEDSSRISWFMGTICSVQVADPIRWPDSPWRLLQVTWDEPELLHNVKCVNPWLVELVSNIPAHLSSFSQPRKKLRIFEHPELQLDGQIPVPPFFGNRLLEPRIPFGCLYDDAPAGMQGARHAHGLSIPDIHLSKFQSGLFPTGFPPLDHSLVPISPSGIQILKRTDSSENVSCLLTMGSSTEISKKTDNGKTPHFLLFGQPIHTEQLAQSCSGGTVSPLAARSDGSRSSSHQHAAQDQASTDCEHDSETGHCKVFIETEDVGRTLDLSLLGSYEELYQKLANMFGFESSSIFSNVRYRDVSGALKQLGDEPYTEFIKTARRLTILLESSNDTNV